MKLLYFLSVLTILQGIVTFLDGRRAAAFLRRPAKPLQSVSGRTVVFCPCKGVDSEFKENIKSILGQEYPDFAVFFIVESAADPAYRALQEMGVTVLIAGFSSDCGQKVHNLRYGVEHAGVADIYVFCDSDARFPRNWLRDLTGPLADDGVAVSTGYRWYVADRFRIPTLLRSAWNASVVSMLGDHGRNFAWGGSMAMRRETFERIGVLDAWKGAVSDDYAVTRAAQSAGAKIVFVPQCLIPSHGDCTFSDLLEFTTRQIIITRVYHPRLWRMGFATQTVFNLTFLWLTAALLLHATLLVAGLWLAIYTLSAARAGVRFSAVRSALFDPSLSRFGWFYILFSPVVSLLYQYNMVCSALTTDIEWRQIHYSLISPNKTRVRRSSASAS